MENIKTEDAKMECTIDSSKQQVGQKRKAGTCKQVVQKRKIDTRKQKLMDIRKLKPYFNQLYLIITPENCTVISKYVKKYPVEFKNFNYGIFVKDWETSESADPLLKLLDAFNFIEKFKFKINWSADKIINENLSRSIRQIIKSYGSLKKLCILNCGFTDKNVREIIKSINNPENLEILKVNNNILSIRTISNNILSIGTIKDLVDYFPNIGKFNIDFNINFKNSLGENQIITIGLNSNIENFKFKISSNRNKNINTDLSLLITQTIKSYDDLNELCIPNCGLTDKNISEIKESIANPENLKSSRYT